MPDPQPPTDLDDVFRANFYPCGCETNPSGSSDLDNTLTRLPRHQVDFRERA